MKRLWFKWFGVKVNAYGRNMIWAVLVDDEPSIVGDEYIIWGTPDHLRTKLFFGCHNSRFCNQKWYLGRVGIREKIAAAIDKNYKELTQDEINERFPDLLESIEIDFTVRALRK